jgi:hypothetical protein
MNTPNNAKIPFVPYNAADYEIVTIKSKGKIILFDPIEKKEFKLPMKVKITSKLAHLEAHRKRVVVARDRRQHKLYKAFNNTLTPVVSDASDVLKTICIYDQPNDEFEWRCVEIDQREADRFQTLIEEWEQDASRLADDYCISDHGWNDDLDDEGFYNPNTREYQWY